MLRVSPILPLSAALLIIGSAICAGTLAQEPADHMAKLGGPDLTQIQAIYTKFFAAQRSGNLNTVNDSIKADWTVEPLGSFLGSGLGNFLLSAGPMTSYRLVRIDTVNELGEVQANPDFYRLKFLALHEWRPIAWEMEFVRARNRWRLFKTDFETEFILDFLEKTPLEFRALRGQVDRVVRRP